MDYTRSNFERRTNTHLVVKDVTTATTLLIVPIKSNDVSIELLQTDLDANVTIKVYVSNTGLDWSVLTDALGNAVEKVWAFADSVATINLSDLQNDFLKIVLDKGAATDGEITAINMKGTGGEVTDTVEFANQRVVALTNSGFKAAVDIDPKFPANIHMEYGLTEAYGTSTATRRVYGKQYTDYTASGLDANTKYYYKIVVETVAGTFEIKQSVTTLA